MIQIPAKQEVRSERLEVRRAAPTRNFAALGAIFLISNLSLLTSRSAHAQGHRHSPLPNANRRKDGAILRHANWGGRDGARVSVGPQKATRMVGARSQARRCLGGRRDAGFLVSSRRTERDADDKVPAFAATGAAKATTFAGRRAFQIEAGGRTLTVDTQTKILLGISGKNGGYALSNISLGPVPALKFTFTAPPGVTVQRFDGALYGSVGAAKRAARWIQAPATLPSGWSFESAIVGQSSAWLRYSNGQHRISLFEQPTQDGDRDPEEVKGGKFWRRGGARFLATGSPPSALDAIVQELRR